MILTPVASICERFSNSEAQNPQRSRMSRENVDSSFLNDLLEDTFLGQAICKDVSISSKKIRTFILTGFIHEITF